MKRIFLPLAGAGIALLAATAAVAAASPSPAPTERTAPAFTAAPTVSLPAAAPVVVPATSPGVTIPTILGLTAAEVMDLRHDGLSLAQIAERQKVDPQKLIDALVAQWSVRIDARVSAGAITADQAAALKANLVTQAKTMVDQTAIGGMRGAAVGAGPAGGIGRGAGMRGAGGPGPSGGMMRGTGGAGTCPAGQAVNPTPAP